MIEGYSMVNPVQLQKKTFTTSEDLVRFATDLIVQRAQACVHKNGVFRFVLSGGSSPKPLYTSLGDPAQACLIPWNETELFWGDERQVGPKSPESNYHLAASTFLSRIALAPRNIHAMHGETDNPESAAQNYEYTIANSFGLTSFPAAWDQTSPIMFPRFDIVLLGMGPDGHTASIFPNSPALCTRRWVLPIPAPEIPPRIPRLTMTAPLLNAAKTIIFLVSAQGKQAALDRIFSKDQARILPAGQIRGTKELFWLILG
jgi:6-phosphogluconolactonase